MGGLTAHSPLQSPVPLSPHAGDAGGCSPSSRRARRRSKPLRVITEPWFLLGFRTLNHPFSSAFNTLSAVRGRKHSLCIQKDKSSLQQLLYLTKKHTGLPWQPCFSKNSRAIYSTAESTGSAGGSCFNWETQGDLYSSRELAPSKRCQITPSFIN